MYAIQENLIKIKNDIAAFKCKYKHEKEITLVAVSKGQDPEKIRQAFNANQINFGENYLQEALTKIDELKSCNIIWHYIGKIQSKKTKLIAQNFSWVQTITSYDIAQLLNKHRPPTLPKLNVCIQVNISNDPAKDGIKCAEILPLATKIVQLQHLNLRGLMTMPHIFSKFDHQFKPFNELFLGLKKLQNNGFAVDTLSMGMSNDFEAAIAAGTTMLRIGTAIFGKRCGKIST